MKAKLIKLELHDGYRLDDENGLLIASTLESSKNKISLKNCQVIERGYDLDELANELLYSKYPFHPSNESGYWLDMYKEGFQKALELIGDKKYSEYDVRNIFARTLENAPSMESHTRMISDVEYRYSVMDDLYYRITKLQRQTEWDVEIEMVNTLENGYKNQPVNTIGFIAEHKSEPKLDADGCLILKRI